MQLLLHLTFPIVKSIRLHAVQSPLRGKPSQALPPYTGAALTLKVDADGSYKYPKHNHAGLYPVT
jgi:hypothetical protein